MRPKRTRKDSNHADVRDDLRQDFIVLDVADLPGNKKHNPLDLIVLRKDDPPIIVACSADGVRRWFDEHPSADAVQVEVKPDYEAPFTVDEKEYLGRLGLWPPTIWR